MSAAARWLPAWARRLINQARLSGAEYKLKLMQDELDHLRRELLELPAEIVWVQSRRWGLPTKEARRDAELVQHLQRDLDELPSYIAWLERHTAAQQVIVDRLREAVRRPRAGAEVRA